MKIYIYLLVAIALTVSNPAIAETKVQTIHIADLPIWKGDLKGLLWLTSPKSLEIYGGEDFPSKDVPRSRQGVIEHPAVIHSSLWEKRPEVNIDSLTLPDGWKVNVSGEGCLKLNLTVQKSSGTGDTWMMEKDRTKGFFERRLGCIGGGANVYHGVLLNSRYFAFASAEPGWIFFDRQTGKFLPLVVQTNPNHLSNLYVTNDGRVLVDAYFGDFQSITSTNIDRRADGIREILFLGKYLVAPLVEEERIGILKLNDYLTCQIDKSYGRQCKQAN
ncbi:MAG: hypothetical protein HOO85_06990 [Methylotenera sp.]|nr:hypothetical protein [Methylotenera sp.]